jgi:hypothetical protein
MMMIQLISVLDNNRQAVGENQCTVCNKTEQNPATRKHRGCKISCTGADEPLEELTVFSEYSNALAHCISNNNKIRK